MFSTSSERFIDRQDAGNKLALALKRFRGNQDCLVVGLPRGGVPVAYQVAKALSIPMDIVAPRKIGCPGNKEFAIGAVAENGIGYVNQSIVSAYHIPQSYVHSETEAQKQESLRRQRVYRGEKRSPANFSDRNIILVDDGIATGSTMKAAIESIKTHHPREIIVAVPVASEDSVEEISHIKGVSEVECLLVPRVFDAVGCFYDDFEQTDDQTVINLMNDSTLIPKSNK